MKAKDKANELVDTYRIMLMNSDTKCGEEILCTVIAKYCALIAVDEIMKAPNENIYIELIPSDADDTSWFWDKYDEYWEQVKQEIEKI